MNHRLTAISCLTDEAPQPCLPQASPSRGLKKAAWNRRCREAVAA